MDDSLWQVKLAAWTHDPAEKALVLLRDPAGHEWGTSARLREAVFGGRSIPEALVSTVKKADHWASAADRPQWPRDPSEGRYPSWTQVDFTEQPVLIHPLSGETLVLEKLREIGTEAIKAVSLDHFLDLLDPAGDAKRSALAFWRFGPTLSGATELGALWGLLPADTRVPDHTIWQHLDLTAALATAFHQDPEGNPALLAVSLGPVQEFIAQARTTSDLWAGSHLLSRVAWEALKVICERLGPDAVLSPQLRGVPQVDLWLRDDQGLNRDWFADTEWMQGGTDANPLFAAALPNKFVAMVPAAEAGALAAEIEQAVRSWVKQQAGVCLDALLERAGLADAPDARRQIDEQLDGFPEVHWAAVPWSPLAETAASGGPPDEARLRAALAPFLPEGAGHGFLDGPAWKLLRGEVRVEGLTFFTPNPGTLYPALYDLLDRAQAAAKSVRGFRQLPQRGYRCTLCGEREWLTHERKLLELPPGKRTETLWARPGVQGTAWARKGEHLCAPCALKRLWPSRFASEIEHALGHRVGRYVVSTHTMALATSLNRWLEQGAPLGESSLKLSAQLEDRHLEVALPRKLVRQLRTHPETVRKIVRRLPGLLENLREQQELTLDDDRMGGLAGAIEDVLGARPEAYYALILMDGDSMGAWLSGTEPDWMLRYRDSWHPSIRAGVENRCRREPEPIAGLPNLRRPVSPARHMAISSALNGFALQVARYVVEDVGKGKLIYAGGDDVLAMLPVDDLLGVMFLLRLAYAGVFPTEERPIEEGRRLLGILGERFDLRRGHVTLNGHLLRMMGHKATASVGAVVAHHQAPMGWVLRQLRAAEQRAKQAGGRDAFAIDLLKRSGGAVRLTCPWLLPRDANGHADWTAFDNLERTPMGQLIRLRDRFAGEGFSRRAAYLTQGWLPDLPEDPQALRAMLGYQFRRQGSGDPKVLGSLGESLADLAAGVAPARGREHKGGAKSLLEFVENFLAVAEFLAREGRSRPEADGFQTDVRKESAV